jgi:hypothetical protein
MNIFDRLSVKKEERRAWVSPALECVGTIGDIVRSGGRKMSPGPDGGRRGDG